MRQSKARVGARWLAMGALVLLILLSMTPARAYAKKRYSSSTYYTVRVEKGFLALRTAPAYDDSNIIGELYTGDVVRLVDSTSNNGYWRVYSVKHGRTGWVNKNYLVYFNAYSGRDYRVTVNKGFLALRTAPAYDDANIIGELYTGDVVTLIEVYNSKYWWVYSSKYGLCGYVNKNYLSSITSSSYGTYTVKVDSGFLALRTAPAYDDANIIGKLYTGDQVQVQDKSNGKYWWVYSPKHGRSGYVNSNYLR